jgi:hypothetical protein
MRGRAGGWEAPPPHTHTRARQPIVLSTYNASSLLRIRPLEIQYTSSSCLFPVTQKHSLRPLEAKVSPTPDTAEMLKWFK